jgi:hypothetical protein
MSVKALFKKILPGVALVAIFLFTGCGNNMSEGEAPADTVDMAAPVDVLIDERVPATPMPLSENEDIVTMESDSGNAKPQSGQKDKARP